MNNPLRTHCWELHHREKEYLKANNGWGMCDTQSGRFKPICVLGGIGCIVNHVKIKMKEDFK